ncbi:MAG: hypothetical protein QW414_07110, partial [Candidatus Bathyarchaeia archaeon]
PLPNIGVIGHNSYPSHNLANLTPIPENPIKDNMIIALAAFNDNIAPSLNLLRALSASLLTSSNGMPSKSTITIFLCDKPITGGIG